MSFSSDSKEQISLKKLTGKAHTKNEAEFFNESKKSGLSVFANTVFGEDLPSSPASGSQYQITDDVVEYIRLPLTPVPESVQNGKYHAFFASLPSTYENPTSDPSNPGSGNSKSGQGIFVANAEIHASLGKIQLVPNSAGDIYEVKVYHGGNAETLNDGSRIPVLDDRKWYFDYFNGILFQQEPAFSLSSQGVNTSLSSGQSYEIKTVGNTSSTQWQSLGLPSSITPAQGVTFIASNSLPADVSGFGSGEVYPAENPDYIEAYIYIGKMASDRFDEGGGGGSNGQDGADGADGADFTFKGNVATKSALLNNISNPEKGDAYFVDVDESQSNIENVIYVYDGSSFISGGSFKGDDGSDGTVGPAGDNAPTISSLSVSGTTITTTLSDSTNVNGSIDFSIDDLSDVDITTVAPSSGQVLKWDGSKFSPENDTGKTDEEIQDIVGAMIDGGTETDISVSYDDITGKLNFVVDSSSILNNSSLTGTPTAPTASSGSDTTQIATTAFVQGELGDYQPLHASLTSIAGLTTSADKLIYTTASDTYATADLTLFARGLLATTDQSTARTALGLGTASTSQASDFLPSSANLDNISNVSITSVQNAQILVYDDDGGDADDKWKNVSITGDITINSSGEASINTGSISNEMLQNSYFDLAVGSNTDRLNFGETLTIAGTSNEIEVSGLSDTAGDNTGATLTIGLPDDVTISGDLTVSGDLTINGDATSIVTTNLDVTDSIISLNNGITGNNTRDIGFFFDRGDLNTALIFWDEADDVFKIGTNSGVIDSTASDLADSNFSFSKISIATPKDVDNNIDLTSNDNTAATTEWTTSKISAIEINDLSDVDTTGVSEGKILKFDENNQLVVAEPNGFVADTASLWAIDPNDSNNIFPHGIIDGTLDTGLFAINLSASDVNLASNNTTLEDIVAAIQNMNAYTTTSRTDAEDTYWEFVDPSNGNYDIQPKDY